MELTSMQDVARFVIAFMLVLGLIGAGALLWRRFSIGPLSPVGPRSRQPRLAVIEMAFVDPRRRLVLIKRDNAEHLLMIGGPTDIVIEPNIMRTGVASGSREPRPIPSGDASRQPTSADPGWTLPLEPTLRPLRPVEGLDAAPPEPPPRNAREAMADSMRGMRSDPAARRSSAELRAPPEDEIMIPAPAPQPMSAEANYRAPGGPEPRRAPPPSPPPLYEPVFQTTSDMQRPSVSESMSQSSDAAESKRTPGLPPRQSQSDENNLAEMAQRLEAALRRPTKPVEPSAPAASARPNKPIEPPGPPAAGARSTRPVEPALPTAGARSTKPVEPAPPVAATRPSKPVEPPAPPPAVARSEPAARKAAYLGSVKSPDPVPSPSPDLKILSGKSKTEPQPPFESLEDEMAKMLGRSPGKS